MAFAESSGVITQTGGADAFNGNTASYSTGNIVAFEGKEYTKIAAVAVVDYIDVNVGTPTLTNQQGFSIDGFPAEQLTPSDSSKVTLRMQSDGQTGFWVNNAGQVNIFHADDTTDPTVFIDQLLPTINSPNTAPFRPQVADYLTFTGSRIGDDVIRLTFKVGVNVPTTTSFTLSANTYGATISQTNTAAPVDSGNPDVNPFWTKTSDSIGDNSFVGLTGLAGVTVTTQGNKQLYTLNTSTRLIISGIIGNNGEEEELITERQPAVGSPANIIVSGTWNAGILKSNPSGAVSPTVYTKGTLWRQTGNFDGANWYNGGYGTRINGSHLAITATGTLNLNGSTFAGPMMITNAEGGTFRSVYQAYILSDDADRPSGNEWVCRYYQGTIDLATVAQEGGILIPQAINSAGGNRIVLVRNNAGVGAWCQSGATNTGGVSFDPNSPGTNYTTIAFDGSNNVVDFVQYANQDGDTTNMGATRLQDCPRGTDIDINGGETTGDQTDNWGYTWMTRRIETNIKSLATGSNQKGAFYIKDYNETGNVRNPSTRITAIDDSADAIYFGKFDGSLTSLSATGPYAITQPDRNNDKEVLLAVNNLAGGVFSTPANAARTRAAKNTGLWVWDDRSNTRTLGESRFGVPFWSYENIHWALNDDLAGGEFTVGEAHTYAFLTSVDPSVTNSRAVITTLSDTTLTTDFAINSNGTEITIGGSRDINLDELYDLCKYKKETSVVEIVKPTVDTLLISSDGTEIDLGDVTLTFTGSAKLIKGLKHTKIKHNTGLDLARFVVSEGMELTAPSVTNMGIVAGTVNYTNNTTTADNVHVAATGIINSGTATTTITGTGTFTSVTDNTGLEPVVGSTKGTWTVAGNINVGGKHSGAMTSNATTGTDSVSGEVTGVLTLASSGRLTLSGILGDALSHVNGPITTTSDSTFKAISAGVGVSNIDGTGIGNVSLLDGNSIVPADIDGTFTSTGGTVTLSGNITGVVNAGGLLITMSTFICGSNVSTDGDGVNNIAGNIAGFLNLDGDSGSERNIVSANVGTTLSISGGVLNLLSGNITGAISCTGTIETTSTFVAQSTTTTGIGQNILDGEFIGAVVLGTATQTAIQIIRGHLKSTLTTSGNVNISGTVDFVVIATATTGLNTISGLCLRLVDCESTGRLTVSGEVRGELNHSNGPITSTSTAVLSGGAVAGAGDSIFDGTIAGFAAGNGNIIVNGTITSLAVFGTGTAVFGPVASLSGTLRKSGSGNANSLTMTAAQAATVDLRVASGTLELFDAVRADYKSVPVASLTHDNVVVIITTTTFEVPAGLPTGRVIMKLRSAASGTFIFDGVHTSGTKTTMTPIDNVTSGEGTYDFYFKPTNVYGDDGIFYLTTKLTGSNDNTSNTVYSITHVEHPDILTSAAEKITTSAAADMNTITTQDVGTVLISGATDEINAPTTQHVLMRVTDEGDYLRLMANTGSDTDVIYPGANDGTVVDTSIITLTSLASNGQMRLTAVVSAGTGTLSGQITTESAITAVLVAANSAGITVPQVVRGIDTSDTGERVKDMRGNKLLGIKPQDPDDN